jgi:hypothetical protein
MDSAQSATVTGSGSGVDLPANRSEPGRGRPASMLAEELIQKQLQVMRQQLEALAKQTR